MKQVKKGMPSMSPADMKIAERIARAEKMQEKKKK